MTWIAVTLLRALERAAQADELIEYFIEKRKNEVGLFDLEQAFFGINDDKIKTRFKQVFSIIEVIPNLEEIFLKLAEGSYPRNIVKKLSEATVDDFHNFFKQYSGDKLSIFVSACLQYGGYAGNEKVRREVEDALKRIGRENKLNAFRLKAMTKIDVLPEISNSSKRE